MSLEFSLKSEKNLIISEILSNLIITITNKFPKVADTIFGGIASSSFTDIYYGGLPSSSFSNSIYGGTP